MQESSKLDTSHFYSELVGKNIHIRFGVKDGISGKLVAFNEQALLIKKFDGMSEVETTYLVYTQAIVSVVREHR